MIHPLEAALMVLATLWPVSRLAGWHRHRVVASIYVLVTVTAIALLLIAGAVRWALAPIVALLVVWEIQATGVMIGDLPPPATSRLPQLIFVVLLVGVVLPAILLPLVVLPRVVPIEGSGPHQVGIRDLVLEDTTDGAPAGVQRSRPIRVWLPGEPEADLQRAGLAPEVVALEPFLADSLLGRRWGWTVRGVTRAALVAQAPMRLLTKQRDFPVVIVSLPEPWSPVLLRRLAVELASHGFVVAEAVPPVPGSTPAMDAWWTWTQLRALAQVGSGDPYAGRLRTDQVGWVGIGATTGAGRILADSGTAAALVTLDPTDDSGAVLGGTPELRLEREGAPTAGGSRRIRTAMPGAMAIDFTDLARWSPWLLRQSGRGGWIAAARMEEWIQGWAAAFLGVHLVGLPADTLRALSSRFPGTTVSLP